MGTTPVRYLWLGLVVAVGVTLVVASPALLQRQQVARAERIRSRCVREFSAKRSWRAEITETETGSDGRTSVTRQQMLVRGPDEYRLTLFERDAKGREIVSTTIRTKRALYTRRSNPDGTAELRVLDGPPPSLGVQYDNLLGETVQALADARPLKVVGTESRNGAQVDKLELGPGRFVWVDQATGLPVEEQVLSPNGVAHSVVVTRFDDRVTAPDGQFDPELLGAVDETITEDLGFRPVNDARSAADILGFAPLDVPVPEGFSADTQGYVDPGTPGGDAPLEAAFVSAFSNGGNGVIVTQIARPGVGDAFVPADSDAGSYDAIQVGGKPAAVFRDAVDPRLVFARRDVLVTIEGNMSVPAMQAFAERIR